ncbi:hypothetical protein SISNIDRAFT_80367 [Sistotremastrum niveocremeum HHB9708]|uniref:Mitochondrial inner membrane protease ATP23 n=1 Tax=Sistotremastrum niveocremeum HHB9708 TaxID=1314777 RepID=A0A164UMK1_9AGAM|nr:hypothetical protein SISNIDRAFT_80367 [Sistotremastrum niveocremeum HHB9708]
MNPGNSTPPSESHEPAFERWRHRLAWTTGLGLTSEESLRRDQERQAELAPAQLAQCRQWKADLLSSSPKITFMLKHLELLGTPIGPEFLHCTPCQPTHAGGTDPDTGNIVLCQGRFMSKKHMEDTITHELLHLYDQSRFSVDWSNLRHHACSEVRASNLSGDCRWGREVRRLFFSFSKQHQACVRRRAVASVQANPSCPDRAAAERAVNEVFDSCFKDTRPFDEIY